MMMREKHQSSNAQFGSLAVFFIVIGATMLHFMFGFVLKAPTPFWVHILVLYQSIEKVIEEEA